MKWISNLVHNFCVNQGYQKNRLSQQLFKVFIVFYTSTATCFGPHLPSSSGTHNVIHKKVVILTTDPLSVIQIVLCALFDKSCRHLFKWDCEVSTRAGNHFVFLVLDVKNVAAKYIKIIRSNYNIKRIACVV
jgi:hypothetical protein